MTMTYHDHPSMIFCGDDWGFAASSQPNSALIWCTSWITSLPEDFSKA